MPAEPTPQMLRVIDALRLAGGPWWGQAEAAAVLRQSRRQAARLLGRMARMGLLVWTGHGYRLSERGSLVATPLGDELRLAALDRAVAALDASAAPSGPAVPFRDCAACDLRHTAPECDPSCYARLLEADLPL